MKQTYQSVLIACLSFGAVGMAYLLQMAWHLEPCTMCIVQRYAFLAVGLGAVIHLGLHGRTKGAPLSVGFMAAAIGVAASAKIQWAISVPSMTCGRDKFAAALNSVPWLDLWPQMFEATGVCGDPVPPVLGLPFHAWSGLLFIGLCVAMWGAYRKPAAQ